MAGTQGKPGKTIPAKVQKPATSGKPAGKGAPGGMTFKGTRTSPTKGMSKGPC